MLLRNLRQTRYHWKQWSRPTSRSFSSSPPPPSTTARLDYDYITSNLQSIQQNIQQRKVAGDPILVNQLHQIHRDILLQVETMRRERNEWSSKIPTLQGNEKKNAVLRAKEIKSDLQKLEIKLKEAKQQLQSKALELPNTTHPDTPVGSEDQAVEKNIFGTFPTFDHFEPKDHLELCQKHNLIDFEAGTIITGPKFAVLRGDLAMLELGLIAWSMQQLAAKRFVPTLVPDLCRLEMIEACGFNPRGPESQIYGIDGNDGLGLIGTAEIPLAGLAAGRTFQEDELPSRVVGFSHAFRREAGSRGAQSKGLYRLHQFSKVEMFVHCTLEQADHELEQLVSIQCELLQSLGLHGRVLEMPTEELGASAHRKMDVEVWMPGRNEYGEVCSASDCTDYQSRRLDTQYVVRKNNIDNNTDQEEGDIHETHTNKNNKKNKKNKKNQKTKLFTSTLNATAMAVPRVMLAILETHQQSDGAIKVPEPMISFLGKEYIGK